ncbi:MAG TPA: DUF1361 domain-containing protein [Ferruginibacter sp.]|nr:DUF1361 domain-containing protein [Ferruginibacter sp.]HRE62370.1 DUF1361 domain-containing protein [Ferruginibacter sp.]
MKSPSIIAKMLSIFLALIAAMILFRIFYSGTLSYIFMSWNIFLAWVPYIISTYLSVYSKKEKWKQLFLFCTWLLFFPNALYIVTDLVHLQDERNMPWYFDAMLLFASAFAGLLLAFVSLKNVERYFLSFLSQRLVNMLIPALLFLGSFGVYLGRFQRWNSWNIVDAPFALSLNILHYVINPFENIKVWAVTFLFTIVYSLLYYSIKILPKAFAEK